MALMMKNKKYFLLIIMCLGLGIYLFQGEKPEKNELILKPEKNELILLEIPEGENVNIVHLSDETIKRRHPILNQFNNISLTKDEIFLSQYRFSNKEKMEEAGKKVVVLDRQSLKLKKEIQLQGYHPKDVVVFKDKLLVKVRSLGTENASGFEVYALDSKQYLGHLNLREDFVFFDWLIYDNHFYVVADGMSLNKKNSPNISKADKKTTSGYVITFKFDINTLKLLDHYSFGTKIVSASDVALFGDQLVIASVTKYSKHGSHHAVSDNKLHFIDIATGKITQKIELKGDPRKILINKNRKELYVSGTDPIFQIVSLEKPFKIEQFNFSGVRDMYMLDENTLLLNQRFMILNGYSGEPQISHFDIDQRKVTKITPGSFGPFPKIFN